MARMSAVPLPCRRQLLAFALGEILLQASSARAPAPARVPLFIGTGKPSDQTPRMLDWFARQLSLSWDYLPTPWLRAQKLAASGAGIMYGLARTPQREKELRFSQPIWTNHTWAVIRQESRDRITRLSDLEGQAICWARGSSYEEQLRQLGLSQMLIREAADDDGALRMLAAGRCRAALLTLETAQAQQAERHPVLADYQTLGLTLMPSPLAATALHFATGHQSPWGWVLDRIDSLAANSRTTLERLRHSPD